MPRPYDQLLADLPTNVHLGDLVLIRQGAERSLRLLARQRSTTKTTRVTSAAMRRADSTGATRANTVAPAAIISSTKLMMGLPIPAVVAVITGRAAALEACTVPAASRPSTKETQGSRPPTAPVDAAKRMPPATGRIKV